MTTKLIIAAIGIHITLGFGLNHRVTGPRKGWRLQRIGSKAKEFIKV